MVDVPIGNDEYVLEQAREIVKREARTTSHAASRRCRTSKRRSPSSPNPSGRERATSKWALDTELSLEACRRADNGTQWAYEKILELPGAAEAQSFFEEWCPDDRLTVQPHQHAQARLSTGARGSGLPSAEARRLSASNGSKMGILPEVLADFTGPLGDRVRRGLPESRIIAQLGGSLWETRDKWGVTKEQMAGIVPESWLAWGLGAEGTHPQGRLRSTSWPCMTR